MPIIKQEYGSFTDVETQQMLAPILYSLIADRNFAIGDLFIYQNKLYKAIKAISTTDPIVIGDGTDPSDNATAASTVSEELIGQIETITTTPALPTGALLVKKGNILEFAGYGVAGGLNTHYTLPCQSAIATKVTLVMSNGIGNGVAGYAQLDGSELSIYTTANAYGGGCFLVK